MTVMVAGGDGDVCSTNGDGIESFIVRTAYKIPTLNANFQSGVSFDCLFFALVRSRSLTLPLTRDTRDFVITEVRVYNHE